MYLLIKIRQPHIVGCTTVLLRSEFLLSLQLERAISTSNVIVVLCDLQFMLIVLQGALSFGTFGFFYDIGRDRFFLRDICGNEEKRRCLLVGVRVVSCRCFSRLSDRCCFGWHVSTVHSFQSTIGGISRFIWELTTGLFCSP